MKPEFEFGFCLISRERMATSVSRLFASYPFTSNFNYRSFLRVDEFLSTAKLSSVFQSIVRFFPRNSTSRFIKMQSHHQTTVLKQIAIKINFGTPGRKLNTITLSCLKQANKKMSWKNQMIPKTIPKNHVSKKKNFRGTGSLFQEMSRLHKQVLKTQDWTKPPAE